MNRIQLLILFLFIRLIVFAGEAQLDSTMINSYSDYYLPENILRFGDFLFRQGSYRRAAAEYQRFLFTNTDASQDRVLYKVGQSYIRTHQAVNASSYFKKAALAAGATVFGDSCNVAFASSLLLSGRNEEFLDTVDSLQSKNMITPLKTELFELRSIYYLQTKRWQKARETLSEINQKESKNTISDLSKLANRGIKLPQKSPLKAGLMSAVIPGSGKIYAGRTSDGIYSLLLVAGTSWLAYEGFRDDGTSSFKGWFFGSVATIFYTGNIYGSIIAVNFYNKRFRDDLAHDVEIRLNLLVDL